MSFQTQQNNNRAPHALCVSQRLKVFLSEIGYGLEKIMKHYSKIILFHTAYNVSVFTNLADIYNLSKVVCITNVKS